MKSLNDIEQKLTEIISGDNQINKYDNLDPILDKDYMVYSPHPVGYSSVSEQQYIFQNLLIGFNPENYTLLDIGSGRGDLYGYLQEIYNNSLMSYSGIDHNPIMIDLAKKRYNIDIHLGAFESTNLEKADWVVASGLFTARRNETEDADLQKLFEDIDKMYKLANNCIAFNLLSPIGNKIEEGFFYVHPGLVMDMLIEKYRYVTVRNNYSNDVYTVTIYKF